VQYNLINVLILTFKLIIWPTAIIRQVFQTFFFSYFTNKNIYENRKEYKNNLNNVKNYYYYFNCVIMHINIMHINMHYYTIKV